MLSLGKLLVDLLQVVKRTDIPLISLNNIWVVGTSINISSTPKVLKVLLLRTPQKKYYG